MKMKSLPILMAALLLGCGGKGSSDGGNNRAPTDKFDSKITGNSANALSGQAAVFDAGLNLAGFSPKNQRGLSPLFSNFMSASYAPPSKESKAEHVKATVQNGACKINLNKEDFQMPSENSFPLAPFKMQIAGTSCPLAINFNVTFTGYDENPCKEAPNGMVCRFDVDVKMSYRVLDRRLVQELGVSSGSATLVFNIDQSLPMGPSSAGAPMIQTLKADVSFHLKAVDLEGAAHLISGSNFADMKIVMDPQSYAMPQFFGAMKEELQYLQEATKISSKLWASINVKGQSADEKYFVDGVRVTAKAYQRERDKFANSIMTFEANFGSEEPDHGDSAPPYPTPPPMPEYPGPNFPPAPEFPQQPGYPPSNPFPPGSGFPQEPAQPPAPTPSPEKGNWACVIEDHRTSDVFIGYGANKFIAESKAKQKCEASGSASCSIFSDCDALEANPQAWYCETSNTRTGRHFGGEGRSKIEAGYFARKECIKQSGTNANFCMKAYDSDCVRQ